VLIALKVANLGVFRRRFSPRAILDLDGMSNSTLQVFRCQMVIGPDDLTAQRALVKALSTLQVLRWKMIIGLDAQMFI
jgi:hypothetical protein